MRWSSRVGDPQPRATRTTPSYTTSVDSNRQRGMGEEEATSMIVNGFCREVFKELPMEFAVEAQRLLSVSLEGAVG